VRARFEGDDSGASTGGLAGLAECIDLGVRRARSLVDALAHDRAGTIENDGTDAWVGVGQGSVGGKLKRTTHQRDVALVLWFALLWCALLWCVDLAVRHVLPLVLES